MIKFEKYPLFNTNVNYQQNEIFFNKQFKLFLTDNVNNITRYCVLEKSLVFMVNVYKYKY